MKTTCLIFLLTILCTLCFAQSEGLWQVLEETTWHYADNWAGQTLVFYRTYSGQTMAIWQIMGSGLCVTTSTIFWVEIQGKRIILTPLLLPYQELVQGYDQVFIYNQALNQIVAEDGMRILTFYSSTAIALSRMCGDILEDLKNEYYDNIDTIPIF